MPRFKITLRYLGTNYHGFQSQPGPRSIQDTLESAFARLLGVTPKLVPSGRTDAGVHALAQVAHFDVDEPKALQRLSLSDFLYRLNSILPEDLNVYALEKTAPDFHARKAFQKTYAYWIVITPDRHPFFTQTAWQRFEPLDLASLKKAAAFLVGTHDFSSFCASDSLAKSKVRTLQSIHIHQNPPAPFFNIAAEEWLCLEFTGDGFLKQMVRNMVGTLYEFGRNKYSPEHMLTILNAKDRTLAFRTAPASGLFLKEVCYHDNACATKIGTIPDSI